VPGFLLNAILTHAFVFYETVPQNKACIDSDKTGCTKEKWGCTLPVAYCYFSRLCLFFVKGSMRAGTVILALKGTL
jgi:hypothetical protein